MARCGLCDMNDVEDWDTHMKSKKHQDYINNPLLMARIFAERKANTIMRQPLGLKEIRVKPTDQIDQNNPDDLHSWHVTIRDMPMHRNELKANVNAILLYLINKYGTNDYRVRHIQKSLNIKGLDDTQVLEDIRYIIHAEAEGMVSGDDTIHGDWLERLKLKIEG